jgi:ring-1,2-phenylacetyl-CoA epoxidase subunit PaaD
LETNISRLAHAHFIVANVPDPEIPALTLADLGILRSVEEIDQQIVVTLTPTYSGCPATEAIKQDVRTQLAAHQITNARVQITLSPAWTTDWITPEGKEKLRAYGIAPPNCSANSQAIQFSAPDKGIACPQCASRLTERVSQFGSTPCKALYRCTACKEPFDYFKPY